MSTLAVVGSRKFPDLDEVVPYGIDQYSGYVHELVSGGALGVDRLAEEIGDERGWRVISYRPERVLGGRYGVKRWVDDEWEWVSENGDPLSWATFPEAAKARNWWIVRDADFVLAFWDGTSSGTAHGIAAATRLKRPDQLRVWMKGDS